MRRIVALIMLALTVSACASSAGGAEFGSAGERVGVIPVADRQPVPVIVGEHLDGQPLALADYAGMPVVLNFWASWCGPCVQEAPALQAVSQAYKGQVQVLGVDIRDTATNAKTFERDLGVTYPSFFDPSVQIAAQLGGNAPPWPPSTLVLDAAHRIAVQHFGAITEPELRGYLDQVLEEDRQG